MGLLLAGKTRGLPCALSQIDEQSGIFYIHNDFWSRELQTPRLVAWNGEDQMRVPAVWNDFVQELGDSTNVLLRMEAKALQLADTSNEVTMSSVILPICLKSVFANREALVANNVEVLYLGWGTGNLVGAMVGNGIVTDTKESLQQLYNAEYEPKLEAMDQEYWNKTVPAGQFLSTFENQKDYLKANKPYDFMEFAQLFSLKYYSKAQALEIQPLVAAYKSNLVTQSQICLRDAKRPIDGCNCPGRISGRRYQSRLESACTATADTT